MGDWKEVELLIEELKNYHIYDTNLGNEYIEEDGIEIEQDNV